MSAFLAGLLALLAPFAHTSQDAPSGFASLFGSKMARVLLPDGRAILAEVAESPAARERGLMFRKHLSPDEGMVFLFKEPGIYPFWMKNCLISLDILWIDRQGRVVHIEKSVPPCKADPCPSVVPLRPSSWVLELAEGQARGVKSGDLLLASPEGAAPQKPTGVKR